MTANTTSSTPEPDWDNKTGRFSPGFYWLRLSFRNLPFCGTLAVFTRQYSVAMVLTKILVLVAVATGGTLKAQRPLRINLGPDLTKAVVDSPQVRRLVGDEEKRQAEVDLFWRQSHTDDEGREHVGYMANHPDEFPSGHAEFLKAIASAPAVAIPGKSHGKVLEISKARCFSDAFSTPTFLRVVVLGKKQPGGTEVWICAPPRSFWHWGHSW